MKITFVKLTNTKWQKIHTKILKWLFFTYRYKTNKFSQINSMDKTFLKETTENLYNSDLKHIDANLEKFIQKKEELMFQKKRNLLK